MNIQIIFFVIYIAGATKWYHLNEYHFDAFREEFNKTYSRWDYPVRREIFNDNLELIMKHNQDLNKTWKRGVNQFTDMTESELKQMLGSRPGRKNQKKIIAHAGDPVSSIDWRTRGVVTAVKNQLQCGSCWAFAAAETLESSNAINTGHLEVLSEQQILDCTLNPMHCGGAGGCNGGTIEVAYDQIIKMGGLSSEWAYPYRSGYGESFVCNRTRSDPVVNMSFYGSIKQNSYDSMTSVLSNMGPIAVSVDASSWFSYESGIFDGCDKENVDLDHAVQLVGMTDNYWLVRNSWGTSWGENGYIRLAKSSVVTCGVDKTPKDGDGCDNGPATETVCGTCGILYDGVLPLN